jgi:hypothetical protein
LFCAVQSLVLHLSFKVNKWRLFANALTNGKPASNGLVRIQ